MQGRDGLAAIVHFEEALQSGTSLHHFHQTLSREARKHLVDSFVPEIPIGELLFAEERGDLDEPFNGSTQRVDRLPTIVVGH